MYTCLLIEEVCVGSHKMCVSVKSPSSAMISTHLVIVVLGPADLIFVDRDACHMGTADRGYGPERTSDAATAVEALHPGLEAERRGDARLMCGLRRLPSLGRQLGREVEALRTRMEQENGEHTWASERKHTSCPSSEAHGRCMTIH